jgi:hypothetical protein
LAAANGLPYPTAYAAVRDLEGKGLVFTVKDGRSRVVRPTDPALPGLAQALIFETPRPDLAKIVHGDRLLQFHVLDRVRKPGLAALVLCKTKRAVEQTVAEFAPSGFLARTPDGFRIHPRHVNYRAFIDEVARVQALARVRRYTPSAVLVWHLGPEVLFKSHDPVEDTGVMRAGFDRFGDFGVELVGRGFRAYHLARRSLGPADAVMEAVLIDGDTPIHRTYCCLLYEKTRPADFEAVAQIYGLARLARLIVRYVDGGQDLPGFLPRKEHERYRREYGLVS